MTKSDLFSHYDSYSYHTFNTTCKGFNKISCVSPPPLHPPPPKKPHRSTESMCQVMLVIPTYYILNTIANSSPSQPALFIWRVWNPKIVGFIDRAASYSVPEVPHGSRGLRPFCGEAARPSRRGAISLMLRKLRYTPSPYLIPASPLHLYLVTSAGRICGLVGRNNGV